jgi:Sec-independent protein secretion pathway component TatC
MKEVWKSNRDGILVVLIVAAAAGAMFEAGAFLMTVLKWPLVVALFVGVVFAIGNDGYHAVKRMVRDKVWPWIKSKPWRSR